MESASTSETSSPLSKETPGEHSDHQSAHEPFPRQQFQQEAGPPSLQRDGPRSFLLDLPNFPDLSKADINGQNPNIQVMLSNWKVKENETAHVFVSWSDSKATAALPHFSPWPLNESSWQACYLYKSSVVFHLCNTLDNEMHHYFINHWKKKAVLLRVWHINDYKIHPDFRAVEM